MLSDCFFFSGENLHIYMYIHDHPLFVQKCSIYTAQSNQRKIVKKELQLSAEFLLCVRLYRYCIILAEGYLVQVTETQIKLAKHEGKFIHTSNDDF